MIDLNSKVRNYPYGCLPLGPKKIKDIENYSIEINSKTKRRWCERWSEGVVEQRKDNKVSKKWTGEEIRSSGLYL